MGAKGRNKKAMETINNGAELFKFSENLETIRINARAEADTLKTWEEGVHFDAVMSAARAKDAQEYDIKRAEELRMARAEYRASLPYAGLIKSLRQDNNKVVTILCGKKNSKRAALVADCYDAYVTSTRNFSDTRYNLQNALRVLLITTDGLTMKTDAKTSANIAGRLAHVFGAGVASTSALAKDADVAGVSLLTLAQFRRLLVTALSAIAVTGTVDIPAC